ncbi:MAG: class I SAM-dependent methyltransferase [Oscillospiraceae bacterium]|jgi:SAM-dependent methyltransferase|nr:class I SAM-dependent methyltransferase [Oscillospiraceae bacterium]MDE6997870.1 class I SAM-dependent methyltransferase [Oscillospiraceae bacterium]
MEDWVKEVKTHWNSVADSDWYMSLRTDEKILRLRENPASAFHPVVFELIKKHVGEVSGRYILLPSSGDNHAAFAFAIMGAEVTSADISERQLDNAKMLADKMGLDIEFVCDNTMKLEHIKDSIYDLVYTSNGTLSWIGDLTEMYKNIHRVLKNQGYSFMYDVHPFNRPFSGEAWKEPQIIKSYHDVMPDIHWRVQDIVNANIAAGLSISELAELPAVDASFWFTYDELIKKSQNELANINDWRKNPMSALPAWLVLASKKAGME